MSDSNLRKQSFFEEKQKKVTLATPFGKEELIVPPPSTRNWRGIFIALLVIVAVLGLIICSIILLSPLEEGPRIRGIHFTLESILGNQFKPHLFNGTWISELELVYRDQYGNIKVFCIENFTTRSLMTNITLESINAKDYKISADLNYILLITDVKKIWKYSFQAKYYVYEISSQEFFPLKTLQEDGETDEFPFLEGASWAPTGNAIVFVYKNNLYYKSRIRKPQVYTLTRNGLPNIFFNGRPDYLYETKILKSAIAVWFSPESTMLAFASFNCSAVGKLQYRLYEILKYQELKTIRYPRSGTANPIVELTIVNMTHPKILKTSKIQPPSVYNMNNEYYLTGVKWINAREISITWLNRRQNLTSISVCKAPNWLCVDVYQDNTAETWISQLSNPIFDRNGTWFLAILPLQDGNRGRFEELCQVDRASRKFIYLTPPPMVVLEILAWDIQNHYVYFTATMEPGTRHLYKTGDRDSAQRSWECLTCFYFTSSYSPTNLNYMQWPKLKIENQEASLKNLFSIEKNKGPQCVFPKVYFNSLYSPKYYVLDCLGPDIPSTSIIETSTNSILIVLDSNSELQILYRKMAVPKIKKFQVELESGYLAQVKLYLPPGLREYEDIVFPLILHVDSAPGSQLVNEKFNVDWLWYLSGNKKIIVAEIDCRGSGFQGEKLVREIYNKLGTAEVEDQIAVITYLKDTLKFIDKQRIGIFGKGHGGYVAAMIMSQDKELFRCGIFVNPITTFLLTDTFSTEKYMGMPNDTNKFKIYADSDLNKRAKNFKGKQFLLISSLADTEVPVEHSMNFAYNLVKEHVIFKHQVYPDEEHDLKSSIVHYYSLMDYFWNECFNPQEILDWESMDSFISFTKN